MLFDKSRLNNARFIAESLEDFAANNKLDHVCFHGALTRRLPKQKGVTPVTAEFWHHSRVQCCAMTALESGFSKLALLVLDALLQEILAMILNQDANVQRFYRPSLYFTQTYAKRKPGYPFPLSSPISPQYCVSTLQFNDMLLCSLTRPRVLSVNARWCRDFLGWLSWSFLFTNV